MAAEHGHAANVGVLVEAGANLLVRDHLGLTPLDLADKAEHAECMAILRAAADKQVSSILPLFLVHYQNAAFGNSSSLS